MSILQRLYDSGINCGVQSDLPHGGFLVWVRKDRDELRAMTYCPTLAECECWLDRTARELYPNSRYARGE